MDGAVCIAQDPGTAVAEGLDGGIPGFHLDNVESAPGRHDKIDLRGSGPVREQQVVKHRRVGQFQQERQVDGPLADMAA